jgi:DUF1680 family protein
MDNGVPRRDFLKSIPTAAFVVATAGDLVADALRSADGAQAKLEVFDYRGVRLRDSRWETQYQAGRNFYLALRDEDILCGFRREAGLSAPGHTLGGWCTANSGTVFGQWLSGMSRMYRATGDTAVRDKAISLFTEWTKTIKPDGDSRMRHYAFDKVVCGLVDLQLYADHADAGRVLEQITASAVKTFQRPTGASLMPTSARASGSPGEWYTLTENLYRAYRLSGNTMYRTFGDEWLYHNYWNKFAQTSTPADAHGMHAYSHVNTFSSAAMAYEVSGDPQYLAIVKNAYDYLQRSQCYATGDYGPNERLIAPGGALGAALETRTDTFETSCGSWAGFKLSRYLMRLTGDAHYGDWMERLFYNGIGAALWISGPGHNFYYSDYRVGSGLKVYNWENYTCCSGTYAQNMADYHNLIYMKDADALYVNLYVPSEVTWARSTGLVTLTQDTKYPDADTTTMTIETASPVTFPLRFRVPSWTRDVRVKVNGADTPVAATPGTWATIARTWTSGDRVEITIPLVMRMEAVDAEHPDRVALVRGPVVYAIEASYHDPNLKLPQRDEDLATWLVPEPGTRPSGANGSGAWPATGYPTQFRIVPPDKSRVQLRFRPFYDFVEGYPYFMYFDRKATTARLW